MLSLNALLLRRKATPANAWSEAPLANVELFYWTDNGLEPLDPADTDVLDAATPGDVIIAILRRFTRIPAWQRFLRDSLNLTGFGAGGGQSLGAAIFCCVSPEDSGSSLVRWVAWTFGTASRALRREPGPKIWTYRRLKLNGPALARSQAYIGWFYRA